MKTTAVARAQGSDVEALIIQARRRQRRRYAGIGIAVAAVLGAALSAFAGLHAATRSAAGRSDGAQQPGVIPAGIDTTVLMWPTGPGQDGTIGLDDLRTGKLRQAGPVVDPGEYEPIMLVSGWIVYVSENGVWATDALTRKTEPLGTAQAITPSATPGDVWLEYGAYEPDAGVITVQSVALSGGRHGPLITLPDGTRLVGGTDAGLLLEPRGGKPGGPFWVWTPGTAPRALPDSQSAEGLAVSPGLVAYGTSCANPSTAQYLSYGGNFGYYACRTLHVLDVVTGRLRSFATPAGTTGWAPTHGGNWAWSFSEIAPSGQLMAAEAVLPPDSNGIARVFILHLTGSDNRPTAVPSSAAFLLAVTAWSPDSAWLFYQGSGQHLWAYNVRTGQARSSSTPCCQYAVMATFAGQPRAAS